MNNHLFQGTGVALVTPFEDNGSIAFEALQKLVKHTLDGSVDFLVALGTTSEAPAMNEKEKGEPVFYEEPV